jgi:predicted nucleic acid-binding protein
MTSRTLIAAPILLLAEVGGAMARRLDRPDIGAEAISRLLAIPTLRLVSMDHAQGMRAGQIAAAHRLRGADAVYVAVAARLDVPLVTWDQEHIHRAAGLITAYTPAQDN